LCMKPLIMAASLAVDSALGVVYFPLAASLTPSNEDLEEFGVFSGDDTSTRTHSLADYAATLLVAVVVAVFSEIVCPAGYACILSSALAVGLAAIPGAQERFPAGEALGWPLLYIYFASAGFTVGAVEFPTLLKFSPLIDF
ncbi:yjcL, partial [Symbiodinium natans]